MVNFNSIPANLRIGLFWAQLDGSRAGSGVTARRILLIGHAAPGNTNDANSPTMAGSVEAVEARYGSRSQLAAMYRAARGANAFDETWVCPVDLSAGAAAATGTITVSAMATASGTLSLYIGGVRVPVTIAAGASVTTVATAITAAITAKSDCPVTATSAAGVVTLTAGFNGAAGNEIDVRHSYRSGVGGEALPAGLGIEIVAMAGGAGVPDLDDFFANLGDEEFESLALGFDDDASLDLFDAEFSIEGDAGRWSWLRQLFGLVYTAFDGTSTNCATYGNARNGRTMITWGLDASPTPFWERAAVWAVVHHRSLQNDPARPLRTLDLPGVLPPAADKRFTAAQKNTLAFDGISCAQETADGRMRVHTSITNYQRAPGGALDDAYLKVNTLATNAYVLRSLRHHVETRFPRHKLANDGTQFGPGQAIVTPAIMRAELAAHYLSLEELGLVENSAEFRRNLIVRRNQTNPDRLDVLYPPDLVNQLEVFAVLSQFRLQYPDSTGAQAVPQL